MNVLAHFFGFEKPKSCEETKFMTTARFGDASNYYCHSSFAYSTIMTRWKYCEVESVINLNKSVDNFSSVTENFAVQGD